MTTHLPYDHLITRAKEIALNNAAVGLLNWDRETYMPKNGLAYRAQQLGYFAQRTHELFTSSEVDYWLNACEQQEAYQNGSVEAANVREWRRQYDRLAKVPSSLVEEFERVRAHANAAWVDAREKNDFKAFAPHLEKVFELTRQMGELWGYKEVPYDALLDGYETNATTSHLSKVFSTLRPALVEMLEPAKDRSDKLVSQEVLKGHYPMEKQAAFNHEVAAAFGFDFEGGRIDVTAHPFCSGFAPGDCRLTTRYDESNFLVALYSVLHEAGHGMYDQGLNTEAFGTPVGEFASLGIHESQSRLWENQIGRSMEFWNHWHARAAHFFPHLKKVSPEAIYHAVNRVEPSFIRIEADQLTYDLHIILRFEMEQALINKEIKVADVPGVWNEKFKHLFGLIVPDDAQGCLQDVHWSEGLIGYFPTYTLGNLNAAQLFTQAQKDEPQIEKDLSHGKYNRLLDWLRKHVHQVGRQYSPQEIIKRATGRQTEASDYLRYLKHKFVA